MIFKVYNGPMDLVQYGLYKVFLPPKCTTNNCQARIAVQLSDKLCTSHALDYVKKWDAQKRLRDFANGEN